MINEVDGWEDFLPKFEEFLDSQGYYITDEFYLGNGPTWITLDGKIYPKEDKEK